jgi:hypothetical protein
MPDRVVSSAAWCARNYQIRKGFLNVPKGKVDRENALLILFIIVNTLR